MAAGPAAGRGLMKKLFLITVLLLMSVASARIYWDQIDQTVTIQPDGTVHVRDERNLRATGDDDFREAFICVRHEPDQELTLGSQSGALDSPSQANASTQACEDGAAGTEVVVRYDSRRQRGHVLFEYELHNTISYWSDTAEWYWIIHDDNSPEVRSYRLQVSAPGSMDFPYDAVVYRFGNPTLPDVSLSGDRSVLDVSFARVPANTGVEIRWLMDPVLFTERGTEPGLEASLQEIASAENIMVPGAPRVELAQLPDMVGRDVDTLTFTGLAKEGDSRVNAVRASVGSAINELCTGSNQFECSVFGLEPGNNRVTVQASDVDGRISSTTFIVRRMTLIDEIRRSPWLLLPGAALVAWLVNRLVTARRKHRDLPSDGMMYPFEPPGDLPPAALPSLLTKPGVPSSSNGFAATVMDLARRGFVEFNGSGRRFSMLVDMNAPVDGLLRFEERALRFLQGAGKYATVTDARGWKQVTNRELRRHGQRQSNFMTRWGGEVLTWLKAEYSRGSLAPAAGARAAGDSLTTPESNRAMGVTAGLSVAVMLLMGLGVFVGEEVVSLGYVLLAVVALVTAILSQGIRRWKDHVAVDVHGWQGFRRTLTDYTRMKDAPDDFFVLWDKYFVYAAALGVAKRYLDNIEKLADARGMNASDLTGRALWMGASASSITNLSSLSANISSMSNSLSSALASGGVSASSGGSSAGGGGGGGGGSSGGR